MIRSAQILSRNLLRKRKAGSFVRAQVRALFSARDERRPIFVMSSSASGSTWIAGVLGNLPRHVFIHEIKMYRDLGRYLLAPWIPSVPRVSGRPLFVMFEAYQRARLWTLDAHARKLSEDRPELLAPENLGRLDLDAPEGTHRGLDTVDSTGTNIFIAPFLAAAYPRGILCYVVRDPRDTVASIRYRKPWGKNHPVEALAEGYAKHFQAFKRHRDAGAPIDLLRYEDWRNDTEDELRSFLQRHDLTMTAEQVHDAVFRHSAEAMHSGKTRTLGNLRKARVGGWRADLTPNEVRAIRPILDPLLIELGYERDADWE